MLASLILLGCLVAGVAAAIIAFLAVGPVPVKRTVNIVSRSGSVIPQAMDVVMPRPVFADLAMSAHFSPAQSQQMFDPTFSQEPPSVAPVEMPRATVAPHVAPLKLRRPRTEQLQVRRERMARGTPPPVHHHHDADSDRTDQIQLFDMEEMTIPEDARPRNRR